jgi:hypothetical protein
MLDYGEKIIIIRRAVRAATEAFVSVTLAERVGKVSRVIYIDDAVVTTSATGVEAKRSVGGCSRNSSCSHRRSDRHLLFREPEPARW